MFLARIRKVKPNVLIYNYKPDALILAFKNYNAHMDDPEVKGIAWTFPIAMHEDA